MEQQVSNGDITRQQLGGMTNKQRFHEGRRIPKQLRRICWELWSPVVNNEDEPDDWQMLEVLDWYIVRRGTGEVSLAGLSITMTALGVISVSLMMLSAALILLGLGSSNLYYMMPDPGWSVFDICISVMVFISVLFGLLGIWLSSRRRRELREALSRRRAMELVSDILGSPAAAYELVHLPALATGQSGHSGSVDARMLADNLELFIGMEGPEVRRHLQMERVFRFLRGSAFFSGAMFPLAPMAVWPLFLINIIMADSSNLLTNRRHELLLAMLDEMYPKGSAGRGKL